MLEIPKVLGATLLLAVPELPPAAAGGALQESLVALVTELFEPIEYPRSSRFFEDLEVEYRSERRRPRHGGHRRPPPEGGARPDRRPPAPLDEQGWVIDDVVLDEVSLAADLLSQMQEILREQSYNHLVGRLGEKLAES
jgi:hypothetical protein